MYLCPLGVLIAFGIGVLILSLVLPRIRERQAAPPLNGLDSLFDSTEPSVSQRVPARRNASERPAPAEIDDLIPPASAARAEIQPGDGGSSEVDGDSVDAEAVPATPPAADAN